jgi:hypothetical protein
MSKAPIGQMERAPAERYGKDMDRLEKALRSIPKQLRLNA